MLSKENVDEVLYQYEVLENEFKPWKIYIRPITEPDTLKIIELNSELLKKVLTKVKDNIIYKNKITSAEYIILNNLDHFEKTYLYAYVAYLL